MWVNIQRITRAPHCANVVWPDLAQDTLEGSYLIYGGEQPQRRATATVLPWHHLDTLTNSLAAQ